MAPTRRSRKSCAAGRAYDVLSQAVCSIATCAYDPRHKAERPAASSLLPPNRLVQGLLERCYRPGPSSASAREQIGKSGRLWSRPIPGRSNRVRGRFACAELPRATHLAGFSQPRLTSLGWPCFASDGRSEARRDDKSTGEGAGAAASHPQRAEERNAGSVIGPGS